MDLVNSCVCDKCGCGKVKKFVSRETREIREIGKMRNVEGRIKYLNKAEITKLSPWVGCLLSDAVLNLDAFGSDFKVKYMNRNNEWINIFMNATLGRVIQLETWNEKKKLELWEAQKTGNAFLDKGSVMVNNYEDADYIMIMFDFPFNAVAFTYLPSTVYNFPQIFNGKMIVAFNSRFLRQFTANKGSFLYETMLHELGHTFGLIHPFDGDLGVVMPGLDYGNVFENRGLYSQNTNLTSIMSYIGYRDKKNGEWYKEGWSTSWSPSDLEALRFGYDINRNSAKYLEYMDYSLPSNIIQTYCSDNDGCILELIPENNKGSVFILDMRKYVVYPNKEGSIVGFASGDAGNTFTHICDRQSFIKMINNGYETLNINLDKIERDCEVKTISEFGFINIYVNGKEADWVMEVRDDGKIELRDKEGGRTMLFSENNDIIINFV